MDTSLHFRLTGTLTAHQVMSTIYDALSLPCKQHTPSIAVITGYEIGPIKKQPHTHSAIYTSLTINTVRARFKKAFGCQRSQYILEAEEDRDSNLSYVTKNDDIAYSPNFEELITPISDITPWVFEDLDYKKQVKELDTRYLNSDMDDDSYLENLLAIHASKGPRTLMLHQIKSHWLALFNRRNRLSVKRVYTMNGYEEKQYYPRQVLVDSIKKYIVD